ncbi:MAG: caspase family protein [Endomicrobium sp.]|nr:caspase family protein [Endomicrobium sp.]
MNYYQKASKLNGCVNDAYSIKKVLDRHGNRTKNFDINFKVSSCADEVIEKKSLKNDIEKLFKDDNDIALFYFSGHGYIDTTGGYLITSECKNGDDGLSMNDLLIFVNNSKAKNKIIILDCCHSGEFGNIKQSNADNALLSEGTTILTASGKDEYAAENNGSGLFTRLFVDAMNGSASDLVGNITPGSIYSHIDQSLGAWEQRPIFKTYVKTFTTLRKVPPPISLSNLKKLVELFHTKEKNFKLDPSFEPESKNPINENVAKFKLLQKYNRINLVVPVGAKHMYFAAIKSKSCKLTILGKYYWNLIKNEKI